MRHSIRPTAAQRLGAAVFTWATLVGSFYAAPALAIFSDDEARRAIIDMRARLEQLSTRLDQVTARVASLESIIQSTTENSSQGQINLFNENEKLRAELARLRGQLEQIARATNVTGSRSKDLYTDLDTRLRQLEPQLFKFEEVDHQVLPREKKLFEQALESLRSADFPKAASAFKGFRTQFPASTLDASALFLEGAAYYATQQYAPAIAARTRFLELYPDHPKAEAAMLNLAASQQESKDIAAARRTLEAFLKRYPESALAADAKSRLKGMTQPPAKAKPAPAPAKSAPAPAKPVNANTQ